MAVKLILMLVAFVVGQIASQSEPDVAKLLQSQEGLEPPPALPDDEGRSGYHQQTLQVECFCQYGYRMCARNPYDVAEVKCLFACYKLAYPYLDLTKFQWVCPRSIYPNYNPQARRGEVASVGASDPYSHVGQYHDRERVPAPYRVEPQYRGPYDAPGAPVPPSLPLGGPVPV